MAFKSAQASRLYLGDFNFTPVTAQAGGDASVDMLDTSTLNDTAKQFIPGLDTSTFKLSGWLDTLATADLTMDQINDLKTATATEPLTWCPLGSALGDPCQMAGVWEASYQTGSTVADKVTFSLDAQTDGPTDVGFILHDNTAVTGTGNGTGVDRTVTSATSAVAHLHVTAFSGFTSVTVLVADSADNVTFGTIGTFTAATGITSQRLAIAGTVRRYVRYTATVSGTGSITFVVAFAAR